MRRYCLLTFIMLLSTTLLSAQPVLPRPEYDSTLYFMHYWSPNFETASRQQLTDEANYLAAKIGSGPYIRNGFQVYLGISPWDYQYPVNSSSIDAQVASIMANVDNWIDAAQATGNIIELHMTSTLFGWGNGAINTAVGLDPRVGQWYYTASGQNPQLATSAGGSSYWSTPSRYAGNWREFKQQYFQALGAAFAERFYKHGDILIAIDGDLEVQLSETRATSHANNYATGNDIADYSPFAVAEFRDWLAHRRHYCDNCQTFANPLFQGQGRPNAPSFENALSPQGAFNSTYGTTFSTWGVEGFDSPVKQVIPGAFSAPFFSGTQYHFQPLPTAPPLLAAWFEFRETMIANAVEDTMAWMTSGTYVPNDMSEVASPYHIPPERIYASQIPADYIAGGIPQAPLVRYFVNGSGWRTGDPRPSGSPGWTAFNWLSGSWIDRTMSQGFFDRMQQAGLGIGTNWGSFEWNPYVPSTAPPPAAPLWPGLPCSNILECIISEITRVRRAGPHILCPFTYVDVTGGTSVYHVKGTKFETALATFIANPSFRYTPRQFSPGTVFTPPQVAGLRTTNNPPGFSGSTINGADLVWSQNIFTEVNNFSWSDWPQMDSFLVYRSSSSDPAAASQVAALNKSTFTLHDVPPTINQRYYYWIKARNNANPANAGALSSALAADVCSQYGDLDGSGTVASSDADKALRLYLGLDSTATCTNLLANVYKPSSTPISPRDALTLLQKANNPSMTLPIP